MVKKSWFFKDGIGKNNFKGVLYDDFISANGIIVFNAFTIGVNTYELNEFSKNIINILDYLITIFFVLELSIRFIGEPKKINFFKSGWNLFDTTIVLISLIPIPNNSSFLLLRLLRVFRVLRIISIIPELKLIIEALLGSIKRVFYVGLLLFIILYIYATIGSIYLVMIFIIDGVMLGFQ